MDRKSFITTLLAVFVAVVNANAALGESPVSSDDSIEFARCQREFAGTTLCYRKANIGVAGQTGRSMVIYLHGGSSCGTDNEAQMSEPGIDSICNYLVHNDMGATFVVPQCPDRSKGWGGIARCVKALLDFTVRTEGVDSARIYIFGGSMGGTGSWRMLSTYPDYFAAGMPCAANPTGMSAENVATTPVLTVMGLEDRVMGADVRAVVDSFIDQLITLGDEAVYETEEGWTHEMTCIQSYTTDRLAWIVSHQRSVKSSTPTVNEEVKKKGREGIYDFQGRRLAAPPEHGLYIENGIKKAR